MAERITLQDKTQEKRIFLNRLIVGGVIAFLLILVLIDRLSWLQISQHEYYSTQSNSYRIHLQSVAPARGLIYDRNGVLLAENVSSSSLMMVREQVPDIEATLELVSQLIALNEDDIEKFRTRLK